MPAKRALTSAAPAGRSPRPGGAVSRTPARLTAIIAATTSAAAVATPASWIRRRRRASTACRGAVVLAMGAASAADGVATTVVLRRIAPEPSETLNARRRPPASLPPGSPSAGAEVRRVDRGLLRDGLRLGRRVGEADADLAVVRP